MIGEKRLEVILKFGFVCEGVGEETREIIRLTRLGLEFEELKASREYFNGWANWKHLVGLGEWAEKTGIPTLKEIIYRTHPDSPKGHYLNIKDIAEDALDLLPEHEK